MFRRREGKALRFSVERSLKNQRGFTLLEMLIVISIVGVLAAVAVPRFTNAVALANTARIQSDLQVLNAAIMMYQTEKGTEPTKIEDLGLYVLDIDNVKPPKGECRLRDGKTLKVTATSYGLLSDEKDGMQATCEGKKISEFWRKE